ncbi:nitroreductase family protein [Velocimicrobium porci]|uniref:Nitroreductase n=1 Tax=Velocimicrobium porci TaxID=2606634 RepID=A0A6L5XZF4_9FIRM|nr:nitroreductase family protein [Velocimicrobium porci]MSS64230.1 nitroreductase [Velocimicrobium porci]
MNLYDAIFVRQSVRSFQLEPIEQRLLNNIMNFANHLESLDDSLEVKYEIIDKVTEQEKHNGSLWIKAPYYFVLYSKIGENYLMNAGYLLEHICLYMTTKGLATCFMQNVGSIKKHEGYEPVLQIAFGKSNKNIYREAKKVKRLKLNEICIFKEEVCKEVQEILNAARMAPSSLNSQPWRLIVYDNRIHLFCRKEVIAFKKMKALHEIDMGIILANLCIGAEEMWLLSELMKSENILERHFRKNEYVATLKLMR